MELEEIVARRNYKFIIDWTCDDCGRPTQIHGISLEGEPSFGKVSITWNEIIHKKCSKGHLNVPVRTCTGCETTYEFEEITCEKCDKKIIEMLELEQQYNELTISIRKLTRKKQETRAEEISLSEVNAKIKYIGYKPCNLCDKVLTQDNKCTDCCHDVCKE